ncbi:MAG: insulinase family protein [Alphaproteobacteria bacterium]|nr:insulinase family protein [Alphaproteobacteria bacterium]
MRWVDPWWRSGLALGVLCACQPLPPRGPVPVEVAAELPRVVVQEDPAASEVLVQAVVRAGSVHDPSGAEGLAALTAAVMAAGRTGARVATPGDPSAAVGAPEVVVDRELVSLQLRCPAAVATGCVDRLADLLAAPEIGEAEVEAMRARALAGLAEGVGDGPGLAAELLDAWIHEGHAYGHPVAGRTGVLPVLDLDRVRAFRAERYVRETTVLGLGGPVTPPLLERLSARSAGLVPRRAPEVPLMRPVRGGPTEVLAVATGGSQVDVVLGHAVGVRPGSVEAVALALALATLDADAAGLLPLDRVGRGAWPTPAEHRRQVAVGLRLPPLPPDAVGPALAARRDALRGLVAQGPDARALASARVALREALDARRADPALRLADAVASVAAGAERVDVRSALHALSDAEVRRAATQHLRPDALRIVAVGAVEGLEEALGRAAAPEGRTAAVVHRRDADGLFR